ncbi:hypothetical protein, partial [Falsiroseomonas sp. E2-1-a20]|uniref:hypothetical protein n=1 Tax=Falsiroseomonas sp. E2-1-a20 TaxID=3239300 RepID=UPI003F3A5198
SALGAPSTNLIFSQTSSAVNWLQHRKCSARSIQLMLFLGAGVLMGEDQGKQVVAGPPSPAEIAELIGLWAMLSDKRRQAVVAFARMIALEPEPPAGRQLHLAA